MCVCVCVCVVNDGVMSVLVGSLFGEMISEGSAHSWLVIVVSSGWAIGRRLGGPLWHCSVGGRSPITGPFARSPALMGPATNQSVRPRLLNWDRQKGTPCRNSARSRSMPRHLYRSCKSHRFPATNSDIYIFFFSINIKISG